MVVTILEARVAPEETGALKSAFEAGKTKLPAQMVEMFLVNSTDDPSLWRAISVWRSREALTEYRRSVETPGGVLMFRSVGAEPVLSICDVAVHARVDP